MNVFVFPVFNNSKNAVIYAGKTRTEFSRPCLLWRQKILREDLQHHVLYKLGDRTRWRPAITPFRETTGRHHRKITNR